MMMADPQSKEGRKHGWAGSTWTSLDERRFSKGLGQDADQQLTFPTCAGAGIPSPSEPRSCSADDTSSPPKHGHQSRVLRVLWKLYCSNMQGRSPCTAARDARGVLDAALPATASACEAGPRLNLEKISAREKIRIPP